MRPSSSLALALGLAACVVPGTALAAGDCNRSIVTSFVTGGPSGNAYPNPTGQGFEVLARDATGALLPNKVVIVDFDRMGPLVVKLMKTQNPGATINCATKEVSQMTNVNGIARFGLCFGGFDVVGSIGVTIDGTQCPTAYPARSTDVDAADGSVRLNDIAVFVGHYLQGSGVLCCDWDLDGQAGLGDFAIIASEFLNGPVREYCP